MPANHSSDSTRDYLVIAVEWEIPSGNAISGVKKKIAEWAKCKRAWDSALRSCPYAHALLMHTTTSEAAAQKCSSTGSPNGSGSEATRTRD